jgi:hypothetical protein
VPQHVARGVLGDGRAQVEAEPPLEEGGVFVVVSIQRKALHVEKAAPVLEGREPSADGGREHGQREVLTREVGHGLAGGPGHGERPLEIRYFVGGEAVEPIVGALELGPAPGGGRLQGLAADLAHF